MALTRVIYFSRARLHEGSYKQPGLAHFDALLTVPPASNFIAVISRNERLLMRRKWRAHAHAGDFCPGTLRNVIAQWRHHIVGSQGK